MVCVEGKCDGTVSLNESCYDSSYCKIGLYCKTGPKGGEGVCRPRVKAGEECVVNMVDPCVDGSLCVDGTCVEKYSLENGDPCIESTSCKSRVCGCIYSPSNNCSSGKSKYYTISVSTSI